jgi:hypothetical protein
MTVDDLNAETRAVWDANADLNIVSGLALKMASRWMASKSAPSRPKKPPASRSRGAASSAKSRPCWWRACG